MIGVAEMESDMFTLKFLLGGDKQDNNQMDKSMAYQPDSYKLSLTSIQEDPDSPADSATVNNY